MLPTSGPKSPRFLDPNALSWPTSLAQFPRLVQESDLEDLKLHVPEAQAEAFAFLGVSESQISEFR